MSIARDNVDFTRNQGASVNAVIFLSTESIPVAPDRKAFKGRTFWLVKLIQRHLLENSTYAKNS